MPKDKSEAMTAILAQWPGDWIVACLDGHISVGPFASMQAALTLAENMNKKGECYYVPIPFAPAKQQRAGISEDARRGYL